MKPIAQTSASGNWKKEPLSPSRQKEVNDKGQIGNQRLRKQEIGKTAGARAGSPKKADTIGTLLAGLMRGKRRENTVEEPRNERGALPTTQAAKGDSGDPGNRAASRGDSLCETLPSRDTSSQRFPEEEKALSAGLRC